MRNLLSHTTAMPLSQLRVWGKRDLKIPSNNFSVMACQSRRPNGQPGWEGRGLGVRALTDLGAAETIGAPTVDTVMAMLPAVHEQHNGREEALAHRGLRGKPQAERGDLVPIVVGALGTRTLARCVPQEVRAALRTPPSLSSHPASGQLRGCPPGVVSAGGRALRAERRSRTSTAGPIQVSPRGGPPPVGSSCSHRVLRRPEEVPPLAPPSEEEPRQSLAAASRARCPITWTELPARSTAT